MPHKRRREITFSRRALLTVPCLIAVALPVAALAAMLNGNSELQPVGDEPGASGSASLEPTGWEDAW